MKQQENEDGKKRRRPAPDDDVSFLGEDDVASSMECTGLIPTPPEDESEARSYADMYTIPTPAPKKKPRHGE